MFIVMNRFQVAPGREADFEQAFRERRRLVDGMPGFVAFDLLRPDGDGVFISMTRWESKADFEAWTQSEAFRNAHGRRHEGMFLAHPQLELFEVVEDKE
jgi:heme-degrading monooxygenase HmoA